MNRWNQPRFIPGSPSMTSKGSLSSFIQEIDSNIQIQTIVDNISNMTYCHIITYWQNRRYNSFCETRYPTYTR